MSVTTRNQDIAWSQIDSPVGLITMAMTQQGLCHLSYSHPENPTLALKLWIKKHQWMSKLEHNDQALLPVRKQLEEYFRHERTVFTVDLDLVGTPFQKRVWEELTYIPYGEVRTYKEIAEAIGSPKSVRAVGGANNKNPVSILIPCHRVIGSNGALVGYGGGLWIKEKLLEWEQGKIHQDKQKLM